MPGRLRSLFQVINYHNVVQFSNPLLIVKWRVLHLITLLMILKRKMSNLSTWNDCISVLLYNSFSGIIFKATCETWECTAQMFSLSHTRQVNTYTWHCAALLTIPLHQLKVHLIGTLKLNYQMGQITKDSKQLKETSRNK